MPNELIPWRPDMPGIPPPGAMIHTLAALAPSQDTQADQLAYFRPPYPIPFVRHAPLPVAALSAHGAVAASSSQTLAARAVNAALPGIQRQNGPVTPRLAAQNVATLDNVPDSIVGGRAAWDSTTQKGAAVDSKGNLLLKNVLNALGSTAFPSTTSTTYAVIPEMTVTFTTKGNKVAIIFTMTIASNTSGSSADGFLAIFKDGVQLSTDFEVSCLDSASSPAYHEKRIVALSLIDSPTAANHTYDVRWKITGSIGLQGGGSGGTARTLQVVELG